MRQMRNTRTGKIAVYDADLIESGRWEEYTPPKDGGDSKANDDKVNVKDEISVQLIKGSKKAKAEKPKAASDESQ